MEERTKQRLIGALVIIGALFIILPFLFHNARPSNDAKLADNTPVQPAVALPTEAASLKTATTPTSLSLQQLPPAPSPPTTLTNAAPISPALTNLPPTALTTGQPSEAPAAATPPAQPSQSSVTPQQSSAPIASPEDGSMQEQPPQDAEDTNDNQDATQDTTEPTSPKTNQSLEKTADLQKTVAVVAPPPKSAAKVHHVAHVDTPAHHGNFSLQLGVFAEKQHALRLVAMLHAHHLSAYTRPMKLDHQIMTAVFVSAANLHQAEALQQHLRAELKINGIIKTVVS